MRSKYHSLLVALLAVFAGACSDVAKTDCNDGRDNDGDGLIDDGDLGCALSGGEAEFPDPVACSDLVDNDGDGLADSADPGCDGTAEDNDETDPIRACNDTMDNDGDGKVDYPTDPGCSGPVDNDEFNPAACGDGLDNDGDARMDYPYDPGCDSMDDDDETDTGVKQCSDGMDNDGDMLADYPLDPGCTSAADPDEFNTVVGACGPSVVITDITGTGEATGDVSMALPNELQSPMCNGYGGEAAFTYTVIDGPKALVISTDYAETTLDTVIYVRTECRRGDTELGCDDDSGDTGAAGRSSHLILPNVPAGTYYIIVDAFNPGSLGNYRLTVEEQTPQGGACDPLDPSACVEGLICREVTPGAGFTCELHVCEDGVDNDGDGETDWPNECGCTGLTDDDETNPAMAAQCCDGADNDADALIDYPADPGCAFAADNVELDECYPGKTVEYLDPVAGATGTTSGATGVTGGSCGGSDSPEKVYALDVTVPLTSLTLSTDNATTTFDTVLYVRDDVCDSSATQVACHDNITWSNTKSVVTFTPTVGHTYFVFVDGRWGGTGNFHISVSGVIAAGGVCDPAITSFACESGYACRESAPGVDDWQCRVAYCNDTVDNDADGFIDWPNDPGCATRSDDNEDFPNPVTACSNGLDDDGDLAIDFPLDPGCTSAADDGELDECVPGVTVIDHPGGTLTGDTTGGTMVLTAPVSCDPWSDTSTSPERVYAFNNTRTLSSLRFSTAGSALDTVLYVRYDDCTVAGTECTDSSDLTISSPVTGYYFAIVDGKYGNVGPFNIAITGIVAPGATCTVGDASFTCGIGYECTGTCTPTACNDTVDNDGDGEIDYPWDPGCTSTSDTDETDPAIAPQCADGMDNDGDGATDYPMDTSCTAASDDNEACTSFGTTTFGYLGCYEELTPATVPCDDISLTGTIGPSSDDSTVSVSLPFTFDYFGSPRSSLSVISNGKIGFPGTTTYTESCTLETDTIAVWWDDLYPGTSGGAVTYQTLGTSPNRRFVVNWKIAHIGGTELFDIRAVLYEGTGDITMCYVDTVTGDAFVDNGASATVGISGSADQLVYSCDTPDLTDGLVLHFLHP